MQLQGGTTGSQTDRQTPTMDGGEQAADEVLVEALVLAHGEDLLPLGVRHLFLDGLCSDLITRHVSTSELGGGGGRAV